MSRMVTCLTVVIVAGVFAWSAAPAQKAGKEPAAPPTPLADVLYKQVTFEGIDDKGATLENALELLSKSHRVTILVNEEAFKAEHLLEPGRVEVGSPPIPRMQDVRFEAVLRKVLQRIPVPSGATVLLRADHIEITTNKAAWREVFGDWAPVVSEKQPVPARRLPVLVHADMRRLPLEQAVELLAERSDRIVTLDGSLDEKKAQTPVTLRLRNTPVDTAALLVAARAGLQVVEMDNVLFVTTPEKAAAVAREHARLRPPRRPTKGP